LRISPGKPARGDELRDHRPALPAKDLSAEERLTRIRSGALVLFAVNGYHRTTIDSIGERAGIRGPSVYKHVGSKQELLRNLMLGWMDLLLEAQRRASDSSDDVAVQLRRMVEAHVRLHCRHPHEAFVGGREIDSLEEPHRAALLSKRRSYESRVREVIERGNDLGSFRVASPRVTSYAILDMCTGVANWFRPDGEMTEDEIAYQYAENCLNMVQHHVDN